MQRIVRHTIALAIQVEGEFAAAAGLDGVHLLEQDAELTALVRQALAAWGGVALPNQPPYELRVQIVPHAQGFQLQIALWWIARKTLQPGVNHTNYLR